MNIWSSRDWFSRSTLIPSPSTSGLPLFAAPACFAWYESEIDWMAAGDSGPGCTRASFGTPACA